MGVSFSRPFGTQLHGHRAPNAEALGYCQRSLRDNTREILVALGEDARATD